eukprot:TRINITY_DN9181_c0_g1_i2.p1 TRINITY_DN9181_c0_g1~~TRINITY_DN9181_c0_g1_i2.p1  ORF type:complete len:711 (+),score=151.33 TRINITY_DN9181_c0_g1_i2:248-2134(+)
MDYQSNDYGGAQEDKPLTAKRSWFFINEGVVALVADVALDSQGQAVVTNLEQTNLAGDVVVDGTTIPSNSNMTESVEWVHHNNVLYLPAVDGKAVVTVSNVNQSGSWQDIDGEESADVVTKPVFSVYINHGISPSLARTTAAYAILPGVSASDAGKQATAVMDGSLFTVLDNSQVAQAIFYHPDAGLTSLLAATWQPDVTFQSPLWTVNIDQPATVIMSNRSGYVSFAVADPDNATQRVRITLDVPFEQLQMRVSADAAVLDCQRVSDALTAVVVDLSSVSPGATVSGVCADTVAPTYTVNITYHSPKPVLSHSNPVGQGYSPCKYTFNPSFIPASDTFPHTGIYVRLSGCEGNVTAAEHIGFAHCTLNGTCEDLDVSTLALPSVTEDPRALFYHDYYYLFDYNSSTKANSDQNTVSLLKTQTPLDEDSYQFIGTYSWHRNACCMMKPKGQRTYCIWGEGPSPFPGLGISYTTDIDKGIFTQVPWQDAYGSPLTSDGLYMLPWGYIYDEVKLEAGTHPVELSTGDWLHFYAAATPGWIPNGNYTAGYIVLDQNNPNRIIQRSEELVLTPTFEYETLCNGAKDCPYSGERKNVIFLCSATPTGNKDEFRLFYGGGDGNVGTAVVQVTVN